MNEVLQEQLAHLPGSPGVYIMRDAQERILYVGKAVSLKNRVRSYFQSNRNHSVKTMALVAKIESLEYILTANEVEALILECNLIKKHRPRYNISLKDDKTYPYIKVTLEDDYPRVHITRRLVKDGARYFGPYADAGAVHEMLRLVRSLFLLRNCRTMEARRPCLEYHIKRCVAPCSGKVDKEEYRRMVDAVMMLLEGRGDKLLRQLKKNMLQAAEELRFEEAARLRDQLAAVEKLTEKQNIVTAGGDQDVLGLAHSHAGVCVQVLQVRGGKLIGREHFFLQGAADEEKEAALEAFLEQYYARVAFVPPEVLLPFELSSQEVLERWLTEVRQSKVELHVPKRGGKHALLLMAEDNARAVLALKEGELLREMERTTGAVEQLQQFLEMPRPPQRMECFDISHIQGAETVASMVVFEDGQPKKEDYRRFKLRTVEGKPDDFLSMQEVLLRRYGEAAEPLPDLIVIDGGKGQLSSALEVIRGVGLEMNVISLAKQFEWVFREADKEPLILPERSESLYLLQRLRDEAHRFAVSYHRKLRGKRNLVSVLDHISGIGPKRRKALWSAFGTLEALRKASLEELVGVDGMDRTAAQAVYDFFRREYRPDEQV